VNVIAVLDWGIGGIATFMRLRAAMPNAALVYRSDAGFAPYGTVAPEVLAARIREVAFDLDRRFGLAALVLACNAASTTVTQLSLPFPVFDVIAPGIELALDAHANGARRIGVIGGQRTIDAAVHTTALLAAGIAVTAIAAQPLSAHVEAGRLDGPELLADLTPALDALGEVEALLLACTHYPALAPVIARLRPGLVLLDPVDRLVSLVTTSVTTSGNGSTWVETSGDPIATAAAALAAFDFRLVDIHVASIVSESDVESPGDPEYRP